MKSTDPSPGPMNRLFLFVPYENGDGLELIQLWRQSFYRAINLKEDVQADPVQSHLAILESIDPALIHVARDVQNSNITGFMVLDRDVIQHLYVHVNYQRQGLGSAFIEQAKEDQQHLSLHTFKRNKGAQRFYEHHGFVITERGFAASEYNPWAKAPDLLADLKYEWSKNTQRLL